LISPDVQQLATASSDKTIKLWNLDGFSLERTLTGRKRGRCALFKDKARVFLSYHKATLPSHQPHHPFGCL
jgi:WD40 repeat protein